MDKLGNEMHLMINANIYICMYIYMYIYIYIYISTYMCFVYIYNKKQIGIHLKSKRLSSLELSSSVSNTK